MKRSEINKIMKNAMDLFEDYKIVLPPFVRFSPEEWKTKGVDFLEVRWTYNRMSI